MEELCKRCKFFDEIKVKDGMYHCNKVNITVWFELTAYAGCGGFIEK